MKKPAGLNSARLERGIVWDCGPSRKALKELNPAKEAIPGVPPIRYASSMNNEAPLIRLVELEAFIHDVATRMPFRYGIACMTAAPALHLRLTIEDSSGRTARGVAADGLPPRWFDKDPEKSLRQNVEDQVCAMTIARDIYLEQGRTPATAAAHWQAALPQVYENCAEKGLNALTSAFGSSFFERAMLDALARLCGLSFFELLKNDLTGLETSSIIPDRPLERLYCRHTVGLGDPVRTADIAEEDRLDDGLPQSLEECIAEYGLHYFKVKVCGEDETDLERITQLTGLFEEHCTRGYSITLDGNEQYKDPRQLIELLKKLEEDPSTRRFCEQVLFIEQPLSRETALSADAERGLRELAALRPIVIDESDDSLDSFRRATELGYSGTSHKNCKGIFKSLLNRRLVCELNHEAGRELYFQSAEDLANLPVIPLQQDLTAVAALGIPHVERNGHHYFRGLGHLPAAEAKAALEAHPDLYEPFDNSVRLLVQNGALELGSLQCVGFGYGCELSLEERQRLEDWTCSM